jgi:hypothetical protein
MFLNPQLSFLDSATNVVHIKLSSYAELCSCGKTGLYAGILVLWIPWKSIQCRSVRVGGKSIWCFNPYVNSTMFLNFWAYYLLQNTHYVIWVEAGLLEQDTSDNVQLTLPLFWGNIHNILAYTLILKACEGWCTHQGVIVNLCNSIQNQSVCLNYV